MDRNNEEEHGFLNYHYNCDDCQNTMRKQVHRLNSSFDAMSSSLQDTQTSRMSGICKNCSTLRDIDGRCGCNGN